MAAEAPIREVQAGGKFLVLHKVEPGILRKEETEVAKGTAVL